MSNPYIVNKSLPSRPARTRGAGRRGAGAQGRGNFVLRESRACNIHYYRKGSKQAGRKFSDRWGAKALGRAQFG